MYARQRHPRAGCDDDEPQSAPTCGSCVGHCSPHKSFAAAVTTTAARELPRNRPPLHSLLLADDTAAAAPLLLLVPYDVEQHPGSA